MRRGTATKGWIAQDLVYLPGDVVFIETQTTYGELILLTGNLTPALSNIQVASEIAFKARDKHSPKKD